MMVLELTLIFARNTPYLNRSVMHEDRKSAKYYEASSSSKYHSRIQFVCYSKHTVPALQSPRLILRREIPIIMFCIFIRHAV
jgi:hypothetical protein